MPMLRWHHDKRASAREMLNHPWLNMEPNYNYKYTEKEFSILRLKLEMKYGPDYVTADLLLDDPREEMNQLIEDEPERYQASSDDSENEGIIQTPNYNDDLDSEAQSFMHRRMLRAFDERTEASLMSAGQQRGRLLERRAREVKVNNSFTGPYPLDPTDFNHLDKGANA